MGQVVGANIAKTFTLLTDGRAFGLGDRSGPDHNGNSWIFVKAGGTLAIGDTVWVDSDYLATAITPALAVTPGLVGFAQIAFATNDYGWVITNGKPTITTLASCAKNVSLYTSDTAGALDDSTLSTSHNLVQGVVLVTTNGASTSTGVAYASFPSVRIIRT